MDMCLCVLRKFSGREGLLIIFSFSRGLNSLVELITYVETQNGKCHSLQLRELTPEDRPGRPSYKTKSCHVLFTGSLAVKTTVTARSHYQFMKLGASVTQTLKDQI